MDVDEAREECNDEHKTWTKSLDCLKKFLCWSVVLNFILFITVIVFLIYQNYFSKVASQDSANKKKKNDDGMTGLMCVSCNDLGSQIQANDTMYDVIMTTDCGRRVCCLRNNTGLQRTVKALISQQTGIALQTDINHLTPEPPDGALQMWKQRQNAAHLFKSHTSNTGSLNWLSHDDIGISFNNLKLKDDSLQVHNPGLYFVYLALTFDFSSAVTVPQVYYNVSTHHDMISLETTVISGKYGGSAKNDRHYTAFVCGLLQLIKFHRVIPFVNDMTYLDRRPFVSYFGLYKIDS